MLRFKTSSVLVVVVRVNYVQVLFRTDLISGLKWIIKDTGQS